MQSPEQHLPEILSYLHLEYGEDADDPDALKLADFSYLGLYMVEDVPTHYWQYPGSRAPHYATCGLYSNTTAHSMTEDAPPESTRLAECPPLKPYPYDLGGESSPIRQGIWFWFRMLFLIPRVIWGIYRMSRSARNMTRELSQSEIGDIFPRWIAVHDFKANQSSVAMLAPATEAEIAATEERLGVALPSALWELYLISDGVAWKNPLGLQSLPPLAHLRMGRDTSPRLSDVLREQALKDQEPAGIQVCEPNIADMLRDDFELLDFAALDDMLVISAPGDGQVLALSFKPLPKIPVHGVIHIEGLCATTFTDLAHWMATDISMFESLASMQSRVV